MLICFSCKKKNDRDLHILLKNFQTSLDHRKQVHAFATGPNENNILGAIVNSCGCATYASDLILVISEQVANTLLDYFNRIGDRGITEATLEIAHVGARLWLNPFLDSTCDLLLVFVLGEMPHNGEKLAVMTMVLVIEFPSDATLCRGPDRGLGALIAGSLTCLKATHDVSSKKVRVQYILVSLVHVLWTDQDYKFMNVDEAFLRWRRDRCEAFYSVVKDLVLLDMLDLITEVPACLSKAEKQISDDDSQMILFKEYVNFQSRRKYDDKILIVQRNVEKEFYLHDELLLLRCSYWYAFEEVKSLICKIYVNESIVMATSANSTVSWFIVQCIVPIGEARESILKTLEHHSDVVI